MGNNPVSSWDGLQWFPSLKILKSTLWNGHNNYASSGACQSLPTIGLFTWTVDSEKSTKGKSHTLMNSKKLKHKRWLVPWRQFSLDFLQNVEEPRTGKAASDCRWPRPLLPMFINTLFSRIFSASKRSAQLSNTFRIFRQITGALTSALHI